MIKVLIGPSCIGKSTWAKEFVKLNKDWYILSRDRERHILLGQDKMGTKEEESLITKFLEGKLFGLLSMNKNVIIDNTHLKNAYIEKYLDYKEVEFITFKLPDLETLIKRNQKRYLETGKLIPLGMLKKQLKDYDKLIKDLENDTIQTTTI